MSDKDILLPPAASDEQQMSRMISLGRQQAEKELAAGTASSQVLTTVLKWGSQREKIELLKLEHEIALAAAKKEDIDARVREHGQVEEVLAAMKSYSFYPQEAPQNTNGGFDGN